MKIIKPSAELIWITPDAEKHIEEAGRTCYKSETKITDYSARNFIKMILKRGHESVLEHGSASIRFICDRGVTHELVRHRLVSYSQESTRYVNYKEGIIVIEPCFWRDKEGQMSMGDLDKYERWKLAMVEADNNYKKLIELGAIPQEARSVLTNSLKTEIVTTTNFREWRHILKLRTAETAHPQIREVMFIAKDILSERAPTIFEREDNEKN